MTLPNIVIVGGVPAAWNWQPSGQYPGKKGKSAYISSIAMRLTHGNPLLHEVAAGSLIPASMKSVTRATHTTTISPFISEPFCKLDRDRRTRRCLPCWMLGTIVQPERTLPTTIWVLALGSQTNDFGTPGAAEHCAFLDSRSQADQFSSSLDRYHLRLSNQG